MMSLAEAEQANFLAAHPDLYERSHGTARLKVRGGRLAIGPLATPASRRASILTGSGSRRSG
jgi:hypothetical protein